MIEKRLTMVDVLHGLFAALAVRGRMTFPNDRRLHQALAEISPLLEKKAKAANVRFTDRIIPIRGFSGTVYDSIMTLMMSGCITLDAPQHDLIRFKQYNHDRCSADRVIEEFPLSPEFLTKLVGEFLLAHEKLPYHSV